MGKVVNGTYKGFQVEVETFGEAGISAGCGFFTEVTVDGILQTRLDFADTEYALKLARHAVDLFLEEQKQSEEERKTG